VKHRRPADPTIATTATSLQEAVVDLERLTAKLVELNLPTSRALGRAGEMLTDAVQLHQRFVTALEQLTAEVAALRDRHNTCAAQLDQQARRIEARRLTQHALEQRFGALAEAARETDELLKAIPQGTEGPVLEAVSAGFDAVLDRLQRAIAEADSIATEAQEAGVVDLQQQADGVKQQLEKMMRLVAQAAPPRPS
jgi:chromosome segregation ATPase